MGKWCEAIEFFKDSQIGMSAINRFETAEILIMLVKTADHQLGGIVSGWDRGGADRVAKFRPVTFKEIKDDERIWGSCGVRDF